MDGGSGQALLQRDIKMQVKKTGRLRRHDARLRKLTPADNKEQRSVPSTEEVVHATDEDPGSTPHLSTSWKVSSEEKEEGWRGTPPSSASSDGPRNSSWADHVLSVPIFGYAQIEQNLLGYFWTHVFRLNLSYLPFSVAHAGRKWLVSTMIDVEPLSDLTLALSACHCRMWAPFSFPLVKDDFAWRYYYDRGLRGLRVQLRSFRKSRSLQGIRVALQLLACNLQLILLDLLRGLGIWPLHLRGMSGLLDMIVEFHSGGGSTELGFFDQSGLEFLVQVFAPFERAGALLDAGMSSHDQS